MVTGHRIPEDTDQAHKCVFPSPGKQPGAALPLRVQVLLSDFTHVARAMVDNERRSYFNGQDTLQG